MRYESGMHRVLLVCGLAGLLLVVLFVGLTSAPESGARAAQAPAPATPRPGPEGDRHAVRADRDAAIGESLWRSLEQAYHDGDRERLVALGAKLAPDQQAAFQRMLAAFDGEVETDRPTAAGPSEVNAPPVGINGNPCSYAAIGDAIAAASDGDTIYIPSGNIYGEQLGLIDKSLTFVASLADCSAEDPGATSNSVIIDGGGASGGTWGGLAQVAPDHTVVFKHISLQSASATFGGILYLDLGSTVVLDNSEVWDGIATAYGGGVRVFQDAALILRNESFIHRNAATGMVNGGGGVAAYRGAITMTGGSAVGLGNGGNSAANQGGGVYLESSTLTMDDSNILGNSAAAEGGGAYAFADSTIELRGRSRIGGYSQVFSNTAQVGGGAYLAGDGTELRLGDLSGLVMNHATDDGGGAYAEFGADIALRGGSAEVVGNRAFSDGGGLFLAGEGTCLMVTEGGGRIEGNEAQGSVNGGGGGIYVTAGASVYAESAIVQGNTTNEYGGGIHVAQDGVPTTTTVILNSNSVISDNTAWLGGGLYVLEDGSEVTLDATRVEGNWATQTGGGVRVFGDSQLAMRNGSTLVDNGAGGFGGGLAMYTGTVSLDVVTLMENDSTGDGGAVAQSGGELTVTDGDIRFNSAGGNGGGIFRSGGTLLLEAVTRPSYLAVNDAVNGGGLYDISGGRVDIRALAGPLYNLNTNGASNLGGGVYLTNTTILNAVGNLVVSTNGAFNGGGAAYANGSALTVGPGASGYTPQLGGANDASNGDGGAIYAENGAQVALHNVRLGTPVNGNEAAGDGGGIYASGSEVLLRDTRVVSNAAGQNGGGVYAANGSEVVIDASYSGALPPGCDPFGLAAGVYCSEIRGNRADNRGAGLYVENSTVTIADTAFIDNVGLSSGTSPGTAIMVEPDASVTVRNGLFTGHGTNENTTVHVASNGAYVSIQSTYAGNLDVPLYVVNGGDVTLTNNVLWENGDDAFYQTGAMVNASCNDSENLLTGPGNISVDPLFVSTARGPFRLGPGSPAVDACGGTLNHDLDNVRRPIDADGTASAMDYDMGAFERRPRVFLPLVLKEAS